MKTLKKTLECSIAGMLMLVAGPIWAAIPTAEENSAGDGAGDGLFAYASGWVQDGIAFGVPTILALVFLWMIWELWSKINEQRISKEPAWNGVIAFGGASVVYFIVASYIAAVVVDMYT